MFSCCLPAAANMNPCICVKVHKSANGVGRTFFMEFDYRNRTKNVTIINNMTGDIVKAVGRWPRRDRHPSLFAYPHCTGKIRRAAFSPADFFALSKFGARTRMRPASFTPAHNKVFQGKAGPEFAYEGLSPSFSIKWPGTFAWKQLF